MVNRALHWQRGGQRRPLEAAARLERDTAGISNCPDLLNLHDSYGSNMQGNLDNIIIGSLAPQMLNLVTELQPGVASTPLSFSEGVAVFMLCKREKLKLICRHAEI